MKLPTLRNYTLAEAAAAMGVCLRTVQRYVAEGILRVSSRHGRIKYVFREDVDYLAAGGSPDELVNRNLKRA